ncbi:MAG TPA: hypothetical protein VK119_03505 [Bacillota bacterium]|nr:hypothetical protein [Bacillota bacterium]
MEKLIMRCVRRDTAATITVTNSEGIVWRAGVLVLYENITIELIFITIRIPVKNRNPKMVK